MNKHLCNLRPWILVVFLFLPSCTLPVAGQETNRQTAFVETKVIDSFSIGVSDENDATNSTPDQRLFFTLWYSNGPVHVACPPHPQYSYKAELFDANGVATAKTYLGKVVGSKFDAFADSSLEKKMRANTEALKKSDLPVWSLMFRPIDLFKIDKPGHYILRLWFQIVVFQRTGPNPGDFVRRLIRFPALDYPLVQSKPKYSVPNAHKRKCSHEK